MSGDVFINYRGADGRSYSALLYSALVHQFGEDRVFLDTESFLADEDYVEELVTRVRSARVVLAVIGPDWLTTPAGDGRAIDAPEDWIRRELVEAFAGGVRVIPVLTDGASLPAVTDLPVDIRALGRCQARYLRRRETIEDLDRLITDLVTDPDLAASACGMTESQLGLHEVLNKVEGDIPGLVVQARSIYGGLHFHRPGPKQCSEIGVERHVQRLPADTGVFVGRDHELTRLEEATGDSDRVVVVAVHGLGGVGKSTLAARFAHHHAERFSLVWWTTADSAGTLEAGLADLAVALDPATSGLPAAQRTELAIGWLASHTGWLLVLDNLTTLTDAQPLLERIRTGTVLITSRHRGGWPTTTTLSLDVLTPNEAIEMLRRIMHIDWPDVELDEASRLCEELGWLPLAIAQAGAYMAQNRITPTRYLNLLAEFPARTFTATTVEGDAQRTMARVWHVTLARLTATPLAEQLLRELAWYAPDNIPRTFLERPERGPDAAEALGSLAAYNMITLSDATISVHRLVQAVTRTPDPDDTHRHPNNIIQARDTATTTLATILKAAGPREPADWPSYQLVVPHALALLRNTDPDNDTHQRCFLVSQVGSYLHGQGRLRDAIALHRRAVTSSERLYGGNHPATLASRNNLAYTYRDAGDLTRAIQLFKATLAEFEQALGADHPDTLRSRNNLASAYQGAGDLLRAIPLYEATLTESQRVLHADHPLTLTLRNNLAQAYQDAGDLRRAIPLFEATIADYKRVLGADHPDTLTSQNNLAGAYQDAGDSERAIPLLKAILADSQRVLDADHPVTLRSRNNLAHAYREMGHWEQAIPLFEATVADSQRALGADHPDTLFARNNVASVYADRGDLERAIPLFEAIIADYKRVLGADHPATLTSQNNLASACWAAGDLERAISLFEANVADSQRVLGTDHPDTLISRNNLAYAYRAAGNLERAIPLYKKATADADRVLGPGHPTTKKIRSNLHNTGHQS